MGDNNVMYQGKRIEITDMSFMKNEEEPIYFMIFSIHPQTGSYTWPVTGGTAKTIEDALELAKAIINGNTTKEPV